MRMFIKIAVVAIAVFLVGAGGFLLGAWKMYNHMMKQSVMNGTAFIDVKGDYHVLRIEK